MVDPAGALKVAIAVVTTKAAAAVSAGPVAGANVGAAFTVPIARANVGAAKTVPTGDVIAAPAAIEAASALRGARMSAGNKAGGRMADGNVAVAIARTASGILASVPAGPPDQQEPA